MALTAAALIGVAVRPTLVARSNTRACERWVDSVYGTLTERQRVAQLFCPKINPRSADARQTALRYVEAGVVRLDMAAEGTGVDSFNVSVAAGIILYEIQSQRAAKNA